MRTAQAYSPARASLAVRCRVVGAQERHGLGVGREGRRGGGREVGRERTEPGSREELLAETEAGDAVGRALEVHGGGRGLCVGGADVTVLVDGVARLREL